MHPRHPYAGALVFTAFSGSHQDAIKKGFAAREKGGFSKWGIPYLPLDPKDVGCSYEEVIRVNSQSGKSGAAWLLQENHGLYLPRGLQVDFSQKVQHHTDKTGQEVSIAELWRLFRNAYGLSQRASAKLIGYQSDHLGQLHSIKATLDWQGQRQQITGEASGLLSAFLDGLRKRFSVSANILDYHEHTLGKQSYSKAATYVQLEDGQDGQYYFGVGIEEDVTSASLQALLNAWSNLIQAHTAQDSASLACCK